MDKLRKIMVSLLSCFMVLATMTASVSAEGEESAEPEPTVLETEPEVTEVIEETQEETVAETPTEEVEEETVIEETAEEPAAEGTVEETLDLELEPMQLEDLSLNQTVYEANAESNDVSTDDLKALGTGKKLTYNGDGTYTLELSVTGDSQSSSETTTQSANVLIIYDVSTSMTGNKAANSLGSLGAYGSGSGAAEATYGQLYKSQNLNNPLSEGEEYSDTLYYYYRNRFYQYTGERYSTATRADAGEKAIYDMVNDIADGDIEFSFVTFSSSAATQLDWTTDSTKLTGMLSPTGTEGTRKLTYSRGTGWSGALAEALSQLAKADDDPTYVIFVTDGRPTDGYENSYTHARNIETYNTVSSSSVTDGTDNTALFGIYAYGLEEDYLDDVIYYAINGSERSNVTDETDTTGVTTNYFKAGNTQALQDAIETIKSNIKNSLNYGGVSYDDGIATDTTNTTLNTSVDGEVSGLKYTVTQGTDVKYTVTTDGENVTFTIDGNDYTGVKGSFKMNEDDTVSYEYYYAVDDNGDPLTFTVGSGDTEATYQYKMGLANYTDGDLNWDLTGIGGLVGGYTYTLSFTVWPVQGAYDAAADLNNGKLAWNTDTQIAYPEGATGDSVVYYTNGIADYPNIVKYSNGTYAVLTNTSQSVEYYVVETEDVDGVVTTHYDGPYETTPTTPAPMSLVGSTIDLIKEWMVSLSPRELTDWVNAGNTLTLRVTKDKSSYMDYTFPSEEGMTSSTDDYGNVYWKQTAAIAPGILLSKTKAEAAGIDTSDYKSVTVDGTVYYVLDEGHEYTVTEEGDTDLHFEFDTQIYHPMLVDGIMKDLSFEVDSNGKIVDGSTAKVDDANLTEIKGTNKLKGGVDIRKEVYQPDMTTKIADCTDEFAFKVTLWSEDAEGKKSPVYTTDDQFENGSPKTGSFGYRVYEDQFDENGNQNRTTVQRDAIYAGTTPAKVTIGTETTEMVFTMQANQYCWIVNVPAGTKYTVEEIQNNAYSHFYSSVSVLAGDDTTGTYKVVEEKKVEGDATALTDHLVDGYVSANSSSEVIFKNWAGSFYVYHSTDNTIEKISFADSRVTGKYDATVDETTNQLVGYKYLR